MKTILVIIAIVAASFALVTTTNVKVIGAIDNSSSSNITTTTTTKTIKAQAGGGNFTDILAVFVPQDIQVSVGQSVTWDNPSAVGEPHTATFVLDSKTATDIISPFAVPNSTQLTAIPPNSNNEPLKVPGQNNVVLIANARSFIQL